MPMMVWGKIVHQTDDNLVFHALTGMTAHTRRVITLNPDQLYELRFDDGRTISNDQRAKAYALMGEIDDWMGNYDVEITKMIMKRDFRVSKTMDKDFSLSNCSMSIASAFIEYLLGFCFANNVPIATQLVDSIREQYGWDMYCLKYRQCMVCGAHADIAHVQSVGIGRNRDHISNIGNYVMTLCRGHHQEQHRVGIKTFMQAKKLKGVKVTPEIQKMLRIGSWSVDYGEQLNLTKENQ